MIENRFCARLTVEHNLRVRSFKTFPNNRFTRGVAPSSAITVKWCLKVLKMFCLSIACLLCNNIFKGYRFSHIVSLSPHVLFFADLRHRHQSAERKSRSSCAHWNRRWRETCLSRWEFRIPGRQLCIKFHRRSLRRPVRNVDASFAMKDQLMCLVVMNIAYCRFNNMLIFSKPIVSIGYVQWMHEISAS